MFAITVHEVAHGWVAARLGDPTAKLAGRLTLNPVKHIDPLGTVVVPLAMLVLTSFIFGWAKPVPVDWRNLRDRGATWPWWRWRAGGEPAHVGPVDPGVGAPVRGPAGPSLTQPSCLIEMAKMGIIINTVLIVLNLLPLRLWMAGRIVTAFLSPAAARKYNALEHWAC